MLAGRAAEDAAHAAGVNNLLGRALHLHPDEQPAAAHFEDLRIALHQRLKALLEERAHLLGVVEQALLLNDIEHRKGGGAGNGVAAEGRAERAGVEQVGEVGAGEAGAEGKAAAKRLGQGEHIGLDAKLLPGEEGAGAAHAGLHLVHQEQEVVLLAERSDAFDELGRGGDDAALGLDGLEHDGDGLIREGGLDGGEVVVIGIGKADGHRVEALLDLLLGGGRAHGQGPAVEALIEGDHFVAAAVGRAPEAGDLDHILVGLGAGVGEEGAVAARELGEALGQEHHIGVVVEIRAVDQVARLGLDGLDHLGVAVAAREGGNAGGEVDILHVVDVHHLAAGAGHQRHGRGIRGHQVLLVKVCNVVSLLTHRL